MPWAALLPCMPLLRMRQLPSRAPVSLNCASPACCPASPAPQGESIAIRLREPELAMLGRDVSPLLQRAVGVQSLERGLLADGEPLLVDELDSLLSGLVRRRSTACAAELPWGCGWAAWHGGCVCGALRPLPAC